MKKISALFFILSFKIILSAQTNAKIAVIDFQSNGTPQFVGNAVADIFTTELKKDKDIIVLERNQIQQVIKERNLAKPGNAELDEAIKFGQILSVDRLIIGSVSKIGDSYTITGKIIEIKSGAIEYAESENCATVDDVETASRYLATKLLNKISRTYHELPDKKYNSKSSNDKIDVSLSARYGVIWGFKIPTMNFPYDSSGVFKITSEEENLSIIEGVMATDFYIIKGLSIKGLLKYSSSISSFKTSNADNYGTDYNTSFGSSFNNSRFQRIGIGSGIQYNFSFSKFQPFIGISGIIANYWYDKEFSGNLYVSGTSSNPYGYSSHFYDISFSKHAYVFSSEIMTGFKVLFTDNFGINFGFGSDIPIYGSQYSNLKVKKTGIDGGNDYIPIELRDIDTKIKFNEKDFLQPPMYFVQLGFTYQI